MSLDSKVSIHLPKGFYGKAGTLEAWNPVTDALVNLSVVRATTATRVNESGLIESVAANVPRRDFLNGGCGELLIEPQRTNNFLQSEDFTTTWVNDANRFIITPAATTGVLSSGFTKIVLKTGESTANAKLIQTISKAASVQTRVATIFAKEAEFDKVSLEIRGNGLANRIKVSWRLDTDAYSLDLSAGGFSVVSQGVTTYANGDKRFHVVYQTDAHTSLTALIYAEDSSASVGDGTSGIFINGFDDQEGTYPTSYIPTTTAAVTRNADVDSASLISALLNDNAGGIYIRGRVFDASVSNVIEISNSSDAANDRVLIDVNSTNITGKTTDGGVEQATLNAAGASNDTEFAVCYNYSSNSFSIQKDGTTAATDSSGTTPSGLDQLRLTDGSTPFYGRVSELVIFNQRPTDTQGEAVTA